MHTLTKILLFLNLFFLQSYLLRFNIGAYPSNLQEVLIGLLALSFLIETLRHKKLQKTILNFPKNWITFSIILLTAISLLIVPIYEQVDFIRHLKFLFFGTTLSTIFLFTLRSQEQRKNALEIAGYGAVLFGIFSLIYNLTGHNVTADHRLNGPLDSAVYLAYYLAPFVLLFLAESLNSAKERKFNIPILIVLSLLLIATKSMGAILSVFILGTAYLINQKSSLLQNRKIKLAIATLGIILLAAVFYLKILPTITTDYSSLDERGEIWITAGHLFSDFKNIIFGLGFGQFEYHYIQNAESVLGRLPLDFEVIQPHNIFLLFLSHFGLLGLLLVFAIYFRLLKKPGDILKYMALYFLLHGLIDTPIFKNDLLPLFLILLETNLHRPYNFSTKADNTS